MLIIIFGVEQNNYDFNMHIFFIELWDRATDEDLQNLVPQIIHHLPPSEPNTIYHICRGKHKFLFKALKLFAIGQSNIVKKKEKKTKNSVNKYLPFRL